MAEQPRTARKKKGLRLVGRTLEVTCLARQDLGLRALFVIPFGPAGSEFGEKLQDASKAP
jgi:hypothetical protein